MKDRLNIIAFAYVFPPDAGSGTYRTLYFSNHWATLGDDVTIVTVREDCFVETALVDYGLCREVHPSIRVVRASAKRPLRRLLAIKNALHVRGARNGRLSPESEIPLGHKPTNKQGIVRLVADTITDLLACPDEHIGWVPEAVRQANRFADCVRIDCIYATGGPWSALLAGLILHTRRKIPLVLDFRDPWIGNPNLASRSPVSRWLQARMESICIKYASIVIANTEELRRDFVGRYRGVAPDRFITVTNGYECIPSVAKCSADQFILVHAGSIYQSRSPLNLLRAVVEIVRDGEIPAESFRVEFVGGVSVSDPALESALSSEGLRDVVLATPRVAHEEAVVRQQRATALLLIQTGFPLQVPRKLYEYLALARPILAITDLGSATARIVNEVHAGYVVQDSVSSIRLAIVSLYQAWKAGTLPRLDERKWREYSNACLAGRLRNVMRGLSSAD